MIRRLNDKQAHIFYQDLCEAVGISIDEDDDVVLHMKEQRIVIESAFIEEFILLLRSLDRKLKK